MSFSWCKIESTVCNNRSLGRHMHDNRSSIEARSDSVIAKRNGCLHEIAHFYISWKYHISREYKSFCLIQQVGFPTKICPRPTKSRAFVSLGISKLNRRGSNLQIYDDFRWQNCQHDYNQRQDISIWWYASAQVHNGRNEMTTQETSKRKATSLRGKLPDSRRMIWIRCKSTRGIWFEILNTFRCILCVTFRSL